MLWRHNDFFKVIAKAIRDLLQLPEPDYRRSIARPHRDVMGLYLEKKARTGAEANRLTYAIFMRTANKIKDYKIWSKQAYLIMKNRDTR